MRTGRQRKAFVLLSTLFVIVVVALLLRVVVSRLPVVGRSSALTAAQEAARRASESGMEYAVAQLREDPTWRGGTTRQTVIDLPGLKVVQESGNVLGTITSSDGSSSEFRLRFNYQDGPAGGDGLDDPSADFVFTSPYVSVNNLAGALETVVPQARGEGASVEDPTAGSSTPPHSVYLVVEGRNGGSSGGGHMLQSTYVLEADRTVDDAVLMAGGGVQMEVPPNGKLFLGGTFLRAASDERVGLRTKGEVRVERPDGPAPIEVGQGAKAQIGHNAELGEVYATYDADKVRLQQEQFDDGKDFYSLPWSQVEQADTDPATSSAVILPGGTYVYGQALGGALGERELRYYDLSYEEYLAQAEDLATDPTRGQVLSPNLAEVRSEVNLANNPTGLSVNEADLSFWNPVTRTMVSKPGFEWVLEEKDLRVSSSTRGVEEMAVVPRAPVKLSHDDTRDYPAVTDPFTPDDMQFDLRDCTVSVPGSVILEGGVHGSGATVTSEDDVSIVSGRVMLFESTGRTAQEHAEEYEQLVLELLGTEGDSGESDVSSDEGTDASVHLNIYAKGDLNLSTYVQRFNGYRNLTFQGLLYSWGDIRVLANRRGSPMGGLLKLRGAAVAYGNDPETGLPGNESRGRVMVTARGANLYWDPQYLPSLWRLMPEGGSFFTLECSSTHSLP